MADAVSGRIRFDDHAGPVHDATVRVRLEDVSQADAPSRQVSYLEIPNYSHTPGDEPLEFTITACSLDPARRYSIRVHLDLDGSGEYSRGDQITTQSYPVTTHGYPNTVEVQLHQIT